VNTVEIHICAGTLLWNNNKGESLLSSQCFVVLAETDGETFFRFILEKEEYEVGFNSAVVLSYVNN